MIDDQDDSLLPFLVGGQRNNKAYQQGAEERARRGIDYESVREFVDRVELALLRLDWGTAHNVIDDLAARFDGTDDTDGLRDWTPY